MNLLLKQICIKNWRDELTIIKIYSDAQMDFLDIQTLNDSCYDCIKELYYTQRKQKRVNYLDDLLKKEEAEVAKQIMKLAPSKYELWCENYIKYMEEWDMIQTEDGDLQPIPRILDPLPMHKKLKLGDYYTIEEALGGVTKYTQETKMSLSKMKESLYKTIKKKGL